jgi:RNA polymerase sigma-70 factor (ECF subfamily)
MEKQRQIPIYNGELLMSNEILISLVGKTISGDHEAFEQLFLSQQQAIAIVIRRMTTCPQDIDDISQEVAIRIFRHISSLKCPETFGAWLRKLVIHECARHFATRNPITFFESGSLDELENMFAEADADCIPFAHVELLELYAEILAALSKLPKTVRKVAALYCFEKMRYREIAARLGIPVGTVCADLYRARKQLREKLQRTKI